MVIFYVSDRHGAVCLSVSCDMCCGALHSLFALWPWIPKAVDVLFFFLFFVLFFFFNFFATLLFSLLFPPAIACAACWSLRGNLRPPAPAAVPAFLQPAALLSCLASKKKNTQANKQQIFERT